jgi:hypothetical protein
MRWNRQTRRITWALLPAFFIISAVPAVSAGEIPGVFARQVDSLDAQIRVIVGYADDPGLSDAQREKVQELEQEWQTTKSDLESGRYYSAMKRMSRIRHDLDEMRNWNVRQAGLVDAAGVAFAVIVGIPAIIALLILFWEASIGRLYGAEIDGDEREIKNTVDAMPGYWDALCTLQKEKGE